jgi:hypothetical protein
MRKTLILLLTAIVLAGCVTEKKAKRGLAPRQTGKSTEREEVKPVTYEQKTESQFYPMLPEQPRLQLLASYTKENFDEFSGSSRYFLQIDRPYDIGAVRGKIYISDRAHKKIIVVDLDNKELGQIVGDYESAGIWVTEEDYKYVADFTNRKIIVFDDGNRLVRTYESEQFRKPVDVAVYMNRIYVSDLNKHAIFVFDKESGGIIQEIGSAGKEEGSFYKPSHVIVDREGNLYVNDFFNFRIQKFDGDGNFIKAFGYPGDTLGAFARPKGIGIDQEEHPHLYVVDAAFENVQIFDDETTNLLLFFGGFGLDPGSMYLPNGIYVDYHNIDYFKEQVDENFKLKYVVYVGNTLGPIKLNVYGFGEWIGEPLQEAENVE